MVCTLSSLFSSRRYLSRCMVPHKRLQSKQRFTPQSCYLHIRIQPQLCPMEFSPCRTKLASVYLKHSCSCGREGRHRHKRDMYRCCRRFTGHRTPHVHQDTSRMGRERHPTRGGVSGRNQVFGEQHICPGGPTRATDPPSRAFPGSQKLTSVHVLVGQILTLVVHPRAIIVGKTKCKPMKLPPLSDAKNKTKRIALHKGNGPMRIGKCVLPEPIISGSIFVEVLVSKAGKMTQGWGVTVLC